MTDKFIEESTTEFAKMLFEVSKTIGGVLWEYVKGKSKEAENYLYKVSSRYIQRFHQRYGYLQILGMNEPMALKNVFVDVLFLDSLEQHKYSSIEKLKESFAESPKENRSLQSHQLHKLDGISIAHYENRLMVVGPPGGGKSTYLRKIGMEFLKRNSSDFRKFIPVLIELKNIDQTNDIEKLILNEFEIADFPSPKLFMEKALNNGNLLILFDGLDEVPSELENATLNSIRNFCDKYNKNKFIVSCRIAAYKGGLTNFKNIEIANLEKEQIKEFIQKWFAEKSKNVSSDNVSEKCWQKINSSEYIATLELAQSPLLLTLLCLVFYYQQDFPKNRSLLYRDAINVLLKEWNAEKRIHSNAIYNEITLPFEELLLSHIAHYYFLKNEYFFDKFALSEFISHYINENLNAPKYLDGAKILNAISIQQGILIERAKNIYSFSHLTFQEYFTAKYIDDHSLIENYVYEHIDNPKWREIFILLCGIMKAGSDDLLINIIKKANETIRKEDKLNNLLAEINNISSLESTDILIFEFFIVLLFCTNFERVSSLILLQSTFTEINPEIYEDVSYSWIIDAKPNVEMHCELYSRLAFKYKSKSMIIAILHETLSRYSKSSTVKKFKESFCSKLNIKYINFTEDENEAVSKYIYYLNFLFECRRSSILVTRNNWNFIEKQILKPN